MNNNGAAFGLNKPEPLTEFPPEVYRYHPNALPPSAIVGLPTTRTDLVQMLGSTSLAGSWGLINAVRAAKLDKITPMDAEIADRVTATVQRVLAAIGGGLESDGTYLTGESYLVLAEAVGITATPSMVAHLRHPDFLPEDYELPNALLDLPDDLLLRAQDDDPSEDLSDSSTGGKPSDVDPHTRLSICDLIATCEVVTTALRSLDLADYVEHRFELTAAARVMSKDPFRLAHHIATLLPISLNEFEHEASLLVLLDLVRAPGYEEVLARIEEMWDAYPEDPDDKTVEELLHRRMNLLLTLKEEQLDRLGEMLKGLEWEFDEDQPVEDEDVLLAATPTLDSLQTLGLTGGRNGINDDVLDVAVTDDFRSFLAYTLRGGVGFN